MENVPLSLLFIFHPPKRKLVKKYFLKKGACDDFYFAIRDIVTLFESNGPKTGFF